MIAVGEVDIDLRKGSQVGVRILCRTINDAMERFYEDPKNVEEFEQWLRDYRAGKEAQLEQAV